MERAVSAGKQDCGAGGPGGPRLAPAGKGRRQLLAALAAAPLTGMLSACGGGGGGGGADAAAATADTADTADGVATAAGLRKTTTPKTTTTPTVVSRSWRMGFSGHPARPTLSSLLTGVDTWRRRAELAVMHNDLPWAELLAGVPARTLVARDHQPLADHYRSLGLQIIFIVDPNDGLSRSEDAAALRALGRSFTEPAVQQVYRDYAVAAASLVQPAVLCLACETNLVRTVAPPALYAAIQAAARAAAADVRAAGSTATLTASVQVEVAWGLVAGTGSFRGITRDLADFPFMQLLGLSSYPFMGYTQPENMPDNYYSRLVTGSGLRPLVVESGWASVGTGTRVSSPNLQARYITRHAALLDSVTAYGATQLLYADPDQGQMAQPIPANLLPFLSLGLTDADFNGKAALTQWDALFARPLKA